MNFTIELESAPGDCAVLVQGEDAVSPVAAKETLLVAHDEALLQLLAHARHRHGVLAGAHLAEGVRLTHCCCTVASAVRFVALELGGGNKNMK